MATAYSVGHGMRRRAGIPSSYTQAAGKSMARFHNTSEENYQEAAAANSVRIPIGAAAPAPVLTGTLVPRKNVQAGDPTNPGSKANRQNIEVIGASYRIVPNTNVSVVDPAVGPTMANARVIPSVMGREGNFNPGSYEA
jgi:hypothetical protein